MKINAYDSICVEGPHKGQRALQIQIDGALVFEVHDGKPEDNNLNNNFKDCLTIVGLLKMAHMAGTCSESFEVEVASGDLNPPRRERVEENEDQGF